MSGAHIIDYHDITGAPVKLACLASEGGTNPIEHFRRDGTAVTNLPGETWSEARGVACGETAAKRGGWLLTATPTLK